MAPDYQTSKPVSQLGDLQHLKDNQANIPQKEAWVLAPSETQGMHTSKRACEPRVSGSRLWSQNMNVPIVCSLDKECGVSKTGLKQYRLMQLPVDTANNKKHSNGKTSTAQRSVNHCTCKPEVKMHNSHHSHSSVCSRDTNEVTATVPVLWLGDICRSLLHKAVKLTDFVINFSDSFHGHTNLFIQLTFCTAETCHFFTQSFHLPTAA